MPMTEKEILELAKMGIKEKMRLRCKWLASGASINQHMIKEMRFLIDKYDELNQRLANYYLEKEQDETNSSLD